MALARRATARRATVPRATTRTAAPPGRPSISRFLPSPRSLLAGLALIGLAAGAYFGARETSVFAVREVVIAGGSPRVQAQVRNALTAEVGRSLVAIDRTEIGRRVSAVPGVSQSASTATSPTRCECS